MPRLAIYFAALAGASAFFLLFPSVDLWVSGLFWRPGEGFFLADWGPFRFLYDIVPRLTEAVLLLALAATAWLLWRKKPLLGLNRPRIAFLVIALLLGPGILVNAVLKDHWGRARPSQVEMFGGTKKFTPAPLPTNQCERNCSFVAGHPAMGFYLVSLAFLIPAGMRRRQAVAAGLAVGALVGIARIAQGGHFFSDVVFSGLLVFGTTWLTWKWVVERDGLRALWGPLDRWNSAMGRASFAAFAGFVVSYAFLDRPLARAFKLAPDWLLDFFRIVTDFGLSGTYLVFFLALFLALKLAARATWSDYRAERLNRLAWTPAFLFLAVAVSGLVAGLIKVAAGRARPKILFNEGLFGFQGLRFQADYWSFPSGHTTTVAALATALWILWPRHLRIYLAAAGLVAASRIIVDAHYLSDVIGGAFVGAVSTLALRQQMERYGIPLARQASLRLTDRNL